MHKHIKHLILLTIILVGLSSLGLIGCAENHKSYNINITIDGKPVNFTKDLGYPYLTKTQRTMVPIRIISENMGYNVDWSKDTWHQGIRKVWINNNTNRIELEIGKSTAIVNGKSVPIDRDEKTGKPVETKAELIGARTYVPLRFITEAMGGKVEYEWKDGNHYIDIITGKDVEEPKEGGTYSGITFDPKKDVLNDGSGRMSEEKTKEFLAKVIANSKFYKENGKYYFKYDKVDVPEGYTVGMGFSVFTKSGSGVVGVFLSPNPFINPEENKIPIGQSFVRQIRNDAVENSDLIMFQIAIVKDGYNEKVYGGRSSSISYKINYDPIKGTAFNYEQDKWGNGHMVPFDASSIFDI
ncbi:copper amine oxidase N-terminal domain-containing protein [Tepidimicrobium xylanilyticum]|uniref:Copper amine oxidase N-terminal domain-containing protein n=1 Tax=Tepidimicrobium xylanilyticum TaxID=1123352 RepID=A0A1H2XI76_9FIRM|nr:copper amine oxidase N-terminal domain-containing protein [Tepidimicrobium xylanilyticum]SDW92555.1 Copper amine oxidase N-terminal domain-containing protein [Tepidimicrobium xylanilyticum]